MTALTERQRSKRGKAMDVHSVSIAVDKADEADVWRLSIKIDEHPPIVRYYDSEMAAMENKKKTEEMLRESGRMRPMQEGGSA